ncbi:glycosyltransferase [Crenobacter sp. SG2305]|uniref:glycosyltransferase n=1 Tax=Crenobacter oryzisoli TaxID=3056844 RepID=UPI0025AAFCD1|nr:glycosyltransferase [Crenobacter sp. SG2305]MDN0084258.1 glycosyltransferase [Crenobacter sp. SG2305]
MNQQELPLPRITIITSTFNCAEALKKTAVSIREQTYKNVQWIVADGFSTDGTIDVIKDNTDIVTNWFSEPDSGIYDAWNKACRLIDGLWILFLGGGDCLFDKNTLSKIAYKLSACPVDQILAYGNVIQLDGEGLEIVHGEIKIGSWQGYRPALPCHQGVFHSSSILKKANPFDTTYKVIADSKLLINEIRIDPCNIVYINEMVSYMELWGVSSLPSSARRTMHEFFRLEKDLGYKIPKPKKFIYFISTNTKFLLCTLFGQDFAKSLSKKSLKTKSAFKKIKNEISHYTDH